MAVQLHIRMLDEHCTPFEDMVKGTVLSIWDDQSNVDPSTEQKEENMPPLVQYYFEDIDAAGWMSENTFRKFAERGIAFSWHESFSGEDYGQHYFLMFHPDGSPKIGRRDVEAAQFSINELVDILLLPVPLAALELLVSTRRDFIQVLPWKNQDEYGKLFKARLLIDPHPNKTLKALYDTMTKTLP